jgi:hypothetical protein
MSSPRWSRLEVGTLSTVSVVDLAVALAVLGRDVRRATEVPFPNAGDHRSWDALARVSRVRIGDETETRARDVQELKRRLEGKRKDGGIDCLILVPGDTRDDRAFLWRLARTSRQPSRNLDLWPSSDSPHRRIPEAAASSSSSEEASTTYPAPE